MDMNKENLEKNEKFGIKRVVDQVVDLDENYYQQVAYALILLWDMEDGDELEGDWVCDLFCFMFSDETKSIINDDNIEIDDIDPREEENFPFVDLESIYKRDVENYGIELKSIVDIENIKSFSINFIENYDLENNN